MRKLVLVAIAVVLFAGTSASGQSKLVSSKLQIKFFSSTPVEDIEANNTTAVSTINPATGEIVFSVPMQGFGFEKALMQKHFNSDKFLDTKTYPKAKLKGKIININKVDLSKDGTYDAHVEGELTIKGITKPVHEMGKVTVTSGKVDVSSKFNITLADYGITFAKGKPASNIAKTVEVTLRAEYAAQ